MLDLRLLGRPELYWQDEPVAAPSAKNLMLLCYLAMQGQAVAREELARLFWKPGKRASVRFALHKLRELPGAEQWLQTPEDMVLVHARTDVADFDHALKAKRYAQALEIWQGSATAFLNGLQLEEAPDVQHWLEEERERLAADYRTALRGHLKYLEASEEVEQALELAQELLTQDALNEAIHRSVMRLEQRLGHSEAALEQFERLRELLEREVGEEPSAETLQLVREIEGRSVSGTLVAVLAQQPDDLLALPKNYIGRAALQQEVQQKLSAQGRVLLQGLGGAGKTALAAHIAASSLREKKDVLWIPAGHDAVEVLFDRVARAYQAAPALSRAAQPAQFIRQLISQQNPKLIVLDDVWNSYAFHQFSAALPDGQAILVTSRQRLKGLATLAIGKLSRADALALLAHHAVRPLEALPQADALCDMLGDHAFSVRIAGITLAMDELLPEALLARIAQSPHNLKAPEDYAEADRDSIVALLTASLDALPEHAYEAFMALGCLFSASTTAELLALVTRRPVEASEEALYVLYRRGLAVRQSQPGSDYSRYQLHDLAYSFAKANQHYRKRSAISACHHLLSEHREDFLLLDLELGNLLAAAQMSQSLGDSDQFIAIMYSLVVGRAYFRARGHSPLSLQLLEEAIRVAQEHKQFRKAHFLLARLGDTYRELKADYPRAIEAYERALSLAHRLEDRHQEILMLSLLGSTHFQQASSEAEPLLQSAYQLAKRYEDDLGLSLVLQNLSAVAGLREDFEQAEQYSLEALAVARKMAQDENFRVEAEKNVFFAMHNLSVACYRQGRFVEALAHLQEALDFATTRNNQLWMAYVYQEMAEVYHLQDERLEAQCFYQQALSLYTQNNATAEFQALRAFLTEQGYTFSAESNAV